jgi:hypothetical protein
MGYLKQAMTPRPGEVAFSWRDVAAKWRIGSKPADVQPDAPEPEDVSQHRRRMRSKTAPAPRHEPPLKETDKK